MEQLHWRCLPGRESCTARGPPDVHLAQLLVGLRRVEVRRDVDELLHIPAQIAPETAAQVRQLALQAFDSVEAAGLARVDFLVRRSDNAIFIIEANTMPGFTQISMYPQLWEASGLPYQQLLDRLIELGFERHAERAGLRIDR